VLGKDLNNHKHLMVLNISVNIIFILFYFTRDELMREFNYKKNSYLFHRKIHSSELKVPELIFLEVKFIEVIVIEEKFLRS
jgi:hypothetical protein